jgi:hypothetical protein
MFYRQAASAAIGIFLPPSAPERTSEQDSEPPAVSETDQPVFRCSRIEPPFSFVSDLFDSLATLQTHDSIFQQKI